jgi:hypothetical protein
MEIIDNYKTPLKKLCKRFLKSRNEWKIKCHAAKNEIKRLSNLNRYFKNRIKILNLRINTLEKEISEAEVKIKRYENRDASVDILPVEFSNVPRRHTYSIGHIMMFLSLVLFSGISLRGAANAIEIFVIQCQLNILIPSWYTGRLWLMRLGLYKLLRLTKGR